MLTTHTDSHAHVFVYMLQIFHSKYINKYIFSWVLVSLQVLCTAELLHLYHFIHLFFEYSFFHYLSLSLSLSASFHPFPSSPSCSPSLSLLNFQQSPGVERLFSNFMPTPAFQFEVRERNIMFAIWSQSVFSLTSRLFLNIYQRNLLERRG